jgi:hypothetical protein
MVLAQEFPKKMIEVRNHPASLVVRNRDNQHRSRDRRKEYIDDLERRVHQFEREGISVTTEVQAAAEKVTKENRLLRLLLAQHGVSVMEIEAYLYDGQD